MAKTSSKQSGKTRAPRRARATRAARATARATSSRASNPLKGISLEAIAAELKRRQSEIPRLEARAKALRGELASIEARIATLSGLGADTHPAKRPSAATKQRAAKKSVMKQPAKAASATMGGGLRKRRNGQPTLAERIVTLLSDGGAPRSPREIAEKLAPSLGRAVNQSFLVQISLTLRKLVNAGQITQPARAQYAAATAAKGGAADAAA